MYRFHKKETKTVDTTSKGSTIQSRRHADNNTTHNNQATRLALHQLPPRMARRAKNLGLLQNETGY
jgi:hypothetical protein